MNNLYLVGFMGTGKTTIGRLIAGRTGRGFADLDELIELKEKRLIADIFAEKGEAYFRRVEKQVLREVAREDDFIVACGGGIVIDPDNIATMKRTGAMVCLTASPGAILRRTQGQSNRPLLNVKDPKAQIACLLKMRAPYYAQAQETIDTTLLSPEEVAGRLIRFVSAGKRPAAGKAGHKAAGKFKRRAPARRAAAK